MKNKTVSIAVTADEYISAVLCTPDIGNENSTTALAFAHGMSNDMNHPSIKGVAEGLAEIGFITLRFNFPYKEKGKQSADPDHKLIRTWQSVMGFLGSQTHHPVNTMVAVGKSLGARIASLAVAEGAIKPDHLIFLGYPLHAPGRTEQLRDAHLYSISCPMLFFEGTRDPFCKLDLLDGVLKKIQTCHELEIIQGGDHGFSLPKSDLRKEKDVHRQIVEKCRGWLQNTSHFK
ncbi:alpha/beta hydrolase family protein [Desulfocicer niacini]